MYRSNTNDTIVYIGDGRHSGFLDCILAGTTSNHSEDFRTSAEGFTFGYVVSGKGCIESDDGEWAIPEGSFYFIRKGCGVTFSPRESDTPWERIWFQADGSMVEDLVRTFRLGDIFTVKANVRRCFLEIHNKLSQMKTENTAATHQRIACLLFEMLTEAQYETFFSPAGHIAGTAEEIRNYLDNNIYNDLSLDLLAEEFDLSKMHIIRLFKKEYGTTPIQYLMDRKIALAKSLLSGTVMPIKEISDLLRYANTQHFSNSFKSAVGTSPNQYRKSIQDKN